MKPEDIITKQLLKTLKTINDQGSVNVHDLKRKLGESEEQCVSILQALSSINFISFVSADAGVTQKIPGGVPFRGVLTLLGKKYIESHLRDTILSVSPIIVSILALIVSIIALAQT